MGPPSIVISSSEIQIQHLPCVRLREKFLLHYHFFLEQKRCLLVVFVNNVVDDAPSRVRCVEEAFYNSAMVDHVIPMFLFQVLLPYTSIIKMGEHVPPCGGQDDVLFNIFATNEFCEHVEIEVGRCGHPRISD